jgi:mono/diheme cytochrome c family protein
MRAVVRLVWRVLALTVWTGQAAVAADLAHGAYLAKAAGCEGCHTDAEHGGAPFAGGRVMATEFGPITTPNLTPDKETGIGRWSEHDFANAMRWGIAPDDTHYVPVFPFPYYSRLTPADLADLRSFLASLPPVRQEASKGAGSWALWARARSALAVALTPHPGPWKPDPGKDAVWNRGAYLVATIGRCGECHTPRTWLGVPDQHRFLAGAPEPGGGKPAPNITSDRKAGIGNWSEADIVQVLTDGHTPDFDEVGGSMVAIVKNTAQLSEEDRRAIAVFLQTVPPVGGAERK